MGSTRVGGVKKKTTRENPELSTWLVNKHENKICFKTQVIVNITTNLVIWGTLYYLHKLCCLQEHTNIVNVNCRHLIVPLSMLYGFCHVLFAQPIKKPPHLRAAQRGSTRYRDVIFMGMLQLFSLAWPTPAIASKGHVLKTGWNRWIKTRDWLEIPSKKNL